MNLKFIVLSLFLLFFNCQGQELSDQIQIVDKITGFKMDLPEGFEQLTDSEMSKMMTIGKEKIDNVYHSDIELSGGDPMMFKKDNYNYFIIHIKDYDPAVDGDYNDAVVNTNNVLYETYRQTFKNANIDTFSSSEKIDGVTFDRYSIKIEIPPKTNMKILSYSTYKEGKDIAVSVAYSNDEIGEEILKALRSAKFSE